eukprot:IDg5004t1
MHQLKDSSSLSSLVILARFADGKPSYKMASEFVPCKCRGSGSSCVAGTTSTSHPYTSAIPNPISCLTAVRIGPFVILEKKHSRKSKTQTDKLLLIQALRAKQEEMEYCACCQGWCHALWVCQYFGDAEQKMPTVKRNARMESSEKAAKRFRLLLTALADHQAPKSTMLVQEQRMSLSNSDAVGSQRRRLIQTVQSVDAVEMPNIDRILSFFPTKPLTANGNKNENEEL